MEEAERVRARLERIEALQRVDAPATALLAEVRGLLTDGEAWLAAGAAKAEDFPAALEHRSSCAKEVTPKGPATTLI